MSILAGDDLTPKNPLERERRLEIVIQRRKQQRWRQHQQTAEQREHHSMNVELLKYFASSTLLGFHSLHVHEVHVRWGFTVETAVILLKNMFEFTFNKARRV